MLPRRINLPRWTFQIRQVIESQIKCQRFPDVQEFDGEVLQRFHFVTELRLPKGMACFSD
jgi:hypothetical protein